MTNQSEGKTRECGACGGSGDESAPYNGLPYACAVCLGSGTILDDSRSRRDAEADAETLTNLSAFFLAPWDETVEDAVYMAKVALRAVPGLRGE